MAICKATYTKNGNSAKASIRYIQHRAGKDGQTMHRPLWGVDGLMGKDEAYRMIDEAEQGSSFYRLILNFDAVTEDTYKDISIRDITEHTMTGIEERFQQPIPWVAATHADHTLLRHVHIVAILPQRLQVADLQAMRNQATEAALAQRREKDKAREQHERGQEGAGWEP